VVADAPTSSLLVNPDLALLINADWYPHLASAKAVKAKRAS